jgi:hypothetical protein
MIAVQSDACACMQYSTLDHMVINCLSLAINFSGWLPARCRLLYCVKIMLRKLVVHNAFS